MSEMISVAEGFQYSVNIAYDLHADDKLKSYIPTQSALQLMEDILQSTLPTATDRSRVLIGAYGKGKSHIVLTILALLMKRDLDLFEKLLPAIQKRDKLNHLIQNYYASDNKLLPVIITGSNTSLTQAFLLALQQTLKENDFYGHSLDPTDKDILLPFLELEDAEVWIYYYNESSKLDLQKNLVRILGKNKFCQYMLCAKPKISFKRITEKENAYKLED
jgi:hypothetical protein